ncbi:MAG TPA: AraC family transcriptional regulator [Telluria sp.]|nr:AraC family transcriptional regulator [Telluria sp.]
MRPSHETISHPDSALRFLHFEVDRFANPLHRHAHWELTWVRHGHGTRQVGGACHRFGPGDLVLLGPDVPHTWISDGSAAGTRPTASVIQFPASLLHTPALPELADTAALAARARHGLAVRGACARQVRAAMERMRTAGRVARLALLMEILAALAAGGSELETIAQEASGGARGLTAVLDWIQANLGHPLRVEQAAAHAHVTAGAFSRYFRRETGRTFTEYVNTARCLLARRLLLETDKPVALIAGECGFATLSNFNQQFRRREGCTPSAVRAARRP